MGMLVNAAAMEEMDSKKFAVFSMHRREKSEHSEKRVIKEDVLDSSSKAFQHLKLGIGKAKGYTDTKKKPSPVSMVRSPLKREIQQLEKRLKDQLSERCALERATMGYRSSVVDSSDSSSMPKPAKEVIREIAVLEVEIMALEQYLLSLYRTAFDQQVCTLSPNTSAMDKTEQPACSLQQELLQEGSSLGSSSKRKNSVVNPNQTPKPRSPAIKPANNIARPTGPGVHRCQSALSHHAVYSSRISPSEDCVARALHTCHSQPLNFFEDGQSTTSEFVKIAEYLGTSIADHIPETPNRISEDMVRCMGAIYYKLADPPLVQPCIPSSRMSSFSSTSALSPQYLGDTWSPGCRRRESNLDVRLINPFRVEGIKEFSGPYSAMTEAPSICRDPQRLSEVEGLLQNYLSLVSRLEKVDPRKMGKDEKLAFWINVHNALMMHAYLVHGVPIINTKNESLLTKAVCVIGGRSVSAHTIQFYILGCRSYFSGQWFRTLLSLGMKLKTGGEWRAYAIERPEPLLHFALCSGSHSDPAVRIYTCKELFQQLEAAKEEYIRATVGIRNGEKILLPKLIDSYAKDKNMSPQGLVAMIKHHLPETLRIAMPTCQQRTRPHTILQWVPHNFAFRYLLSKELASPQLYI